MTNHLEKIETIKFPTIYGQFNLTTYSTAYSKQPIMKYVIVLESKKQSDIPLVRIQSACLFGETFRTTQCDCGTQLDMSLKLLSEQGGILFYLDQEGRGHGIFNKTRELKLQEDDLDTVEASERLNLQPDERDYQVVIDILHEMNIRKIKLITNNPRKLIAFESSDIELVERVPLEVEVTIDNSKYLHAKKHKLGHLLGKYVK
ncbi:MAG: GTP cyclohydrolase II [Candidatus Dojkabacteria bacterium]